MLTLEEVLSDVAASPGFDGADPVTINSIGRSGQTPLHWMATLGDVPAVTLLLNAGADIHAPNHSGNTALHEAIVSRQTAVVNVLVQHGASLSAANNAGYTPLELAMTENFLPSIEALKNAP